MESLDEPPTDEPDLTMIDTGMIDYHGHVFMNELREYNLPLYNFFHHKTNILYYVNAVLSFLVYRLEHICSAIIVIAIFHIL